MSNRLLAVIGAGVILVALAWLFRYDQTRVENGIYMVDRWTGKVYIVSPGGKREATDINRPIDPERLKRIDAFLDEKPLP